MTTDTPGVELDQYQKEKEEFSDAVDDVLSADETKTDEEIIAEMDKKKADNSDVGGEPKKDPDVPAAKDPEPDDKSKDDDLTGQGVIPATQEIEDPPITDADGTKTVESLEAELAKEKQKTSSWNGRITAANTKAKELEEKIATMESAATKAVTKEADTSNDSDNEVLERFRTDFPELAGVIDILQKRVDGIAPAVAPVKADPEPDSTKSAADDTAVKQELEDHVSAIRKVHPDLSEMVNTGVLLTWINQQPEYIRPSLETIYRNGKPEEVINMVTEFKSKTSWKSQLDKTNDSNNKSADDKLNSMREVNSETIVPDGKTVDKSDYDQGAKDAGL
jgi:hypothetical protein